MGTFIPILAPIFKKLLIQFIVSAITSKIFGKKGGRKGARGPGSSTGILVNQSGNNDAIPVVYGRQRMGGTRAFINTTNGNVDTGLGGYSKGDDEILNMVLILCEGEMGDIEKVYFQDRVVWDSSDGGTTDTSGVGTGGARLQNFKDSNHYSIEHMAYYAGTNTQTVDTTLQNSIGASTWDNNRKLLGLAYLACKLPWSEKYNGSAPEITVELGGKKIRAATNPVGSASASADQNPADVLLDYCTNETYGKGIADTSIDFASFASARTYFDGTIGSPAAKRFTINGFVNTGDKLFDNVEEILQACNGILTYTNGKYKLKPQTNSETSVLSISEDNLVGSFQIQMTPKSSRFNKVELTFNDAGVDYNDNLVIVSNSSYKTQDNETELKATTETTLVSNSVVAGNIAEWIMENSRDTTTVSFTASHDTINTTNNTLIDAGEIIDITHPVVGWTNKLFRVQQVTLTEDDTLEFIVSAYDNTIQI